MRATAVREFANHFARKTRGHIRDSPKVPPKDGSLLAPREEEVVPLPAGPPILMVLVDAEAEFDWDGPFSRSHVSVRNLSQQGRAQEVFDRLNVRPTYLVDYAVATQPDGYRPIREFLESGRCEIGSHLQPWENPPFAEELGDRTSFTHNLPAWMQREKLQLLTEAIVSNFGVRPTTYRAGRYGVGDESARILASLDYEIDLSALPGHDLRWRHGPDFRRALNRPYWFGPGLELLEIPLTTCFSGLLAQSRDPPTFNATLLTALSSPRAARLHLPGVLARLGLLERITLSPEGRSIDELKRLTRQLLSRSQRVFTFNYHSSSLLPGCTPYVRTHDDLDRWIDTVEEYLHFFIEELNGIPMTPTEFRRSITPSRAGAPELETVCALVR